MEVGCLWWWERQDILSRGYVGRGPSTAGLQGHRALGVAQPRGAPLPAGQMGGYSSGDSDAQLLSICSVTDLLRGSDTRRGGIRTVKSDRAGGGSWPYCQAWVVVPTSPDWLERGN